MSAFVTLLNLDGSPVDAALLKPMLQRIAYRGPDGQASWVNGQIAMGHSLYITCDEDIPQPFTLGHITISAHVRLDARDELIPALRSAGVDTTLNTPDVELLAKAYLAWDDDFLNHVIGDFTFALWDAQKQKLIAARDQFGVLPLFYARVGNALLLSTEIGAIRRHPAISTRLDEQYIGDFLVVGNPLWLDKTHTIFADISRLSPAHFLKVEQGQITVQRYWMLPHDDSMLRYRKEEQYIEHFLDVFRRAVKDRMRAKRIVVTLSGGLDSSAIAAVACELVQNGHVNAELNAFTAVYDRIHPDTEAFFAAVVARRLGLPHHIFAGDGYPLAPPLNLMAEPIQSYQRGLEEAFARKTESLGQVSLGGYAGDEVLWRNALIDILRGMPPNQAAELFMWQWRFLGRRPPLGGLREVLRTRKPGLGDRGEFGYAKWINPEFENRFKLGERYSQLWTWEPENKHLLHPDAYNAIVRLDRQMMSEFLHDTASPQLLTSPFLDIRVTRFVLSLPPLPWYDHKYLLRRTFASVLPQNIITRKKTPLGDLLNSLLYQPGSEWVNQWQPLPELSQYVRRDAIPPLTGDSRSSDNIVNMRPLLLNEWMIHYQD